MDDDFERRLKAAQDRGTPVDRSIASGPSAWGIGARVGVELLSALIVGLGIGWALDRWLHTTPLFLVVGVFLGGAGGFWGGGGGAIANVWRLMAPKRGRN